MEGNNCGEEGGWTRIGFVNMSEPGTTCPTGLAEGQYDNIGLNHTALNGILFHCSTICQSHYYFSHTYSILLSFISVNSRSSNFRDRNLRWGNRRRGS